MPFPSNYELILKYIKNNPKLLNYEDSIRMKYATPISKEKKISLLHNFIHFKYKKEKYFIEKIIKRII